jgi:hypothetical protein
MLELFVRRSRLSHAAFSGAAEHAKNSIFFVHPRF